VGVGLLVAGALLVLGGCSAPVLRTPCTDVARPPRPRVWVLRTGWHTGFALVRRDLGTRLEQLLDVPSAARSVVFGWGDLRWYAEGHDGVINALRALLPSRSVLWVEACRHRPERCLGPSTHWRVLPLTARGLRGLDRFLVRSLALTADGNIRPFGPVSPWGEFLHARAPYDAFHTCNTWTAEALAAGGLPVTSWDVLFAGQLWSELPRVRCRVAKTGAGGPLLPARDGTRPGNGKDSSSGKTPAQKTPQTNEKIRYHP
jgi:hypothetical protein